MITADSVISPTDVMWRSVAGEVVLLLPDGTRVMGLNGTGGDVWTRLDGVRSLGDIAAELAATYSQPGEAVAADVLEFGRLLVERKLAQPKGV